MTRQASPGFMSTPASDVGYFSVTWIRNEAGMMSIARVTATAASRSIPGR
jgi:hypothetical protein